MNEADTRAEYIDKQLASAGWDTGGDVRVQREYNINAGEIKAGGKSAEVVSQITCGLLHLPTERKAQEIPILNCIQ